MEQELTEPLPPRFMVWGKREKNGQMVELDHRPSLDLAKNYIAERKQWKYDDMESFYVIKESRMCIFHSTK